MGRPHTWPQAAGPQPGLDCTGPADVFLLIRLVNKAAVLSIALASGRRGSGGSSGWEVQAAAQLGPQKDILTPSVSPLY